MWAYERKMIRKHKKYSNPRKRYDSVRISAENKLVERFALKNKREIWKVEAKVRYFRNRAKKLVTASLEDQQRFFNKLSALGLKVTTISDVLALTKEDLLQRRLTSILVQRALARTPQEARQMIVHRRVRIGGGVVNAPGYIVPTREESHLVVKRAHLLVKKEEAPITLEEPVHE